MNQAVIVTVIVGGEVPEARDKQLLTSLMCQLVGVCSRGQLVRPSCGHLILSLGIFLENDKTWHVCCVCVGVCQSQEQSKAGQQRCPGGRAHETTLSPGTHAASPIPLLRALLRGFRGPRAQGKGKKAAEGARERRDRPRRRYH